MVVLRYRNRSKDIQMGIMWDLRGKGMKDNS